MTSLQFSHYPSPHPYDPPEWGTGKPVEHVDITIPKNPTWRYTGEPITQYYGLTKLKLSNVRLSDELVPRPQSVDIQKEVIHRPFPAEHPYDSHIPRFAVFPKFDSPDDPKRGVAARSEQPISSEMPAHPDNTWILQKIKGFPYRHELEYIPKESEKKALLWPGENFFDQGVKTCGDRKEYFPVPPKSICPNLQRREGDMKVSDRTANALRNVEREQWMTSQNLNFTGLGPSNPVKKDNLEEKRMKHLMTGREDDKLYQHFISTFDPTRPMEGRIPSLIGPLPIHQKSLPSGKPENPNYKPKPTLTEKEEHRLLYGSEYLNLPETNVLTSDPKRDVTWRDLDESQRAGPALERYYMRKLEKAKREAEEHESPFPQAGPPPPPEETYMAQLKRDQDEANQQMEASSRFRELELQTPASDRQFLRIKMDKLLPKEKPQTFYSHEGTYNEERSGLYNTSYDPHVFADSMNANSGMNPNEFVHMTLHPHIMYNMTSLNQPGGISVPSGRMLEDNQAALKWSRTFSLHQPELSGDRRDGTEILTTYNWLKNANRSYLLPPPAHQASARVQEKQEFLQKEATTMGDSYNTVKFLQENALEKHQRADPLSLMSYENQNLANARSRSVPLKRSKSVSFNKRVSFATQDDFPSYSGLPLYTSETLPLKDDCELEVLPAPPLDTEKINRPKPNHYSMAAKYPMTPSGEFKEYSYSSGRAYPDDSMAAVRSSAPGALDSNSNTRRTVRFSEGIPGISMAGGNMNDNNNNNNNNNGSHYNTYSTCRDIAYEESYDRYRTFPKKPFCAHGHGLGKDTEYTDQFHSHNPSSIMPTGLKSNFQATSYQGQFPVQHFDIGFKKDARFDWQPGSGIPRPQSCLIPLQDSFSQTETRRRFHNGFPEKNPELRFNITQGKRHAFNGFNAQVIHG